jgi:FixJ family two-component response regulator
MNHITRSRPTIVVVGDDPAVRNSLKFALEIEGYVVRDYVSAGALLAEPTLPDQGCLIIDYRLPGRDGLELLAKLRQRNIAIPAILLATEPSGELRVIAAKAGVPIVEKPLVTRELFQCIDASLAQGSAGRESIHDHTRIS